MGWEKTQVDNLADIKSTINVLVADPNAFRVYLQDLTYETDLLFADLSEDFFDMRGYLVNNFEFVTENIVAADSAASYISIRDRIGNGGVAIYEDRIEDLFIQGGESTEGGFVIYSTVSARGPIVSNPELRFFGSTDSSIENYYVDSEDDPTVSRNSELLDGYRYYYDYHSREQTELHSKYACIPGMSTYTQAPTVGYEYLENQINDICLEIFNTVLTREFVPKIIKQNRIIQKISGDSSLGEEEQQALGSTIASNVRVY